MKHAIIFLSIFLFHSAAAQLTKEQRIQDSVIGWDPNKKYDHYLKTPTTPIGKQHLVYVNKMVEWVTKSYTPVGGLGEYIRYVEDYGFGVNLTVWNVGYNYLDEKKHFRPIPEENTKFYFTANQVYGTNPIYFMNKKGETFFTMQPNGYSPNSSVTRKREGMDKTVHPNVSKYITWVNDWVTIYLAPNNKLPMKPVSRGELLDKAEASLDGVIADSRKEEAQRWKGNKKGEEEAMAYIQKEVDKYRKNIQTLRQKYAGSLQEQAFVMNMQTDWRNFTADSWDIFKGAPNTTYYPVYKFDAATLEAMKGEKPLWLTVAIPFENKTDGNQLLEMYTAMTQNLNYDYIYQYFFEPEKVKDKPYKPANEEQLTARLDAYRKKNKADIQAVADTKGWASNTHFQDDFSSAAEGADPVNWSFNRHDEHDQVVAVNGQPGKWLKLGYNNTTIPSLLKKPFPANFTLSFDVLTDDFSGRYGGGVTLYLSTNQAQPSGNGEKGSARSASLEINLNAGNQDDYASNYRGEIRMKLYRMPEVNEQNYNKGAVGTYMLKQFTNQQKKITVKLVVNNGQAQVLINGQAALGLKDLKLMYGGACKDCSFPTDLNFNYIYWKSNQRDAHAYIGNVKVTKN